MNEWKNPEDSFSSVHRWFRDLRLQHTGSKGTEEIYSLSLKYFCDFLGIENPDILIKEWEEVETFKQAREFTRKYHDNLKGYADYLATERKLAKGTIATMVASVRSFFNYNSVDLPKFNVKPKFKYKDLPLTMEQLIQIIRHPSTSLRNRTFYKFMLDSGLRPATLLQLQIADLKEVYNTSCGRVQAIWVEAGIQKGQYFDHWNFITEDSIQFMEQYFKQREDKGEVLKPESLIFTSCMHMGAIEKYLGSNALERFEAKRERVRGILREFKDRTGITKTIAEIVGRIEEI